MLSGRGLCDEMITLPEESYRLWCVVVCGLEKNLKNEEAMTRVKSQRHKKRVKTQLYIFTQKSTLGIQLHVSALYIGHRQVVL